MTTTKKGFGIKHYCSPIVGLLFISIVQSNTAYSGELYDMLANNKDRDSLITAAKYRLQAAQQRVITEKRAYRPLVSMEAEELYVSEDVDSSNPIFRDGNAKYGNTRIRLNIEQPIYDASIRLNVESEQKRSDKQSALVKIIETETTRSFLQSYFSVALYDVINQSYLRVIQQLERELGKANVRLDRKLATVDEIENLKLQLVSSQRDARLNRVLLQRNLGKLGKTPTKNGIHILSKTADLSIFSALKDTDETAVSPKISALENEISSLELQAEGKRKERLPKVNLLGLYEYDDANESIFGGDRRLESYAVGVGLRWKLYQRGTIESKTQELLYQQLAKEAELEAVKGQMDKGVDESKWTLDASLQQALDAEKLVNHQATIKQALDKGYQAGTASFASSLDAMLYYEATVREWEKARYEVLFKYIDFKARLLEFSDSDIRTLDALFVAAKA